VADRVYFATDDCDNPLLVFAGDVPFAIHRKVDTCTRIILSALEESISEQLKLQAGSTPYSDGDVSEEVSSKVRQLYLETLAAWASPESEGEKAELQKIIGDSKNSAIAPYFVMLRQLTGIPFSAASAFRFYIYDPERSPEGELISGLAWLMEVPENEYDSSDSEDLEGSPLTTKDVFLDIEIETRLMLKESFSPDIFTTHAISELILMNRYLGELNRRQNARLEREMDGKKDRTRELNAALNSDSEEPVAPAEITSDLRDRLDQAGIDLPENV
jgi:hypothetical protein